MFGSICCTSNSSRPPVRARRYRASTVQTQGISTLPIDANRSVRDPLAFENLELLSRIIHMVRTALPRYKVLAMITSVSTRTPTDEPPQRVRILGNCALIAIKTAGIDPSQCRESLAQSTVRTLLWRSR
jgi:hypothetical protein